MPRSGAARLALCCALLAAVSLLGICGTLRAAPVDDLQRLLKQYDVQSKAGEHADAERTARQMLDVARNNFGDNMLLLARIAGLVADSCSKQSGAQKRHDAAAFRAYVVQLYERAAGRDSPEVADALQELGDHNWYSDDFARAADAYRRALAIRQQRLGRDDAKTNRSRSDLSQSLVKLGQFDEAVQLAEEAVDAAQRRAGAGHADVVHMLIELSRVRRAQGQFAEAEQAIRRAVAMVDADGGNDHAQAPRALSELGEVLQERLQYDEAERALARAIAAAETDPDENFDELVAAVERLGHLFSDTGRYAEAERLHRRSLQLREDAYGADHLEITYSLGALANVYTMLGRFAEAESLHKRSLAIREQWLAPGSANYHLVATSLHNLGSLYFDLDRYAEAEAMTRRALAIREEVLGPEHRLVAETLGNLGAILRGQSRREEAVPLYERALEIYEKALGPDHRDLASTLTNLANCHTSADEFDEAEALYQRALRIQVAALGENNADVVYTWQLMAHLAHRRGDGDSARQLYERSLTTLEKLFGRDHPQLADCASRLARLHFEADRLDEAAELIDRAIDGADRTGVGASERYDYYLLRARISWADGQRSDALADLRTAMSLAEEQRGHRSGAERERAEYFSIFSEAFERMVAWQLESGEAGDAGEAFDAMERARARSLLDELKLPGVDLDVGRSAAEREALAQAEQELRQRIGEWESYAQQLHASGADEADREEAARELTAARQALYEHHRDARSSSPVYRNLLSTGSGRPRISRVQRSLLGERGLLLEYLFGDYGGYLLVVDGRSSQLLPIEVAAEDAATLGIEAGPLVAWNLQQALMDDEGHGVLQLLADPRRAESAAPQLAALWRTLVPAAQRERLAAGGYDRLIVVPDGPLALLPLETLVVREGPEVAYLLDVGPPIHYAPSTTVLVNLDARGDAGDDAGPAVLAVGDPATGATAAPGDAEAGEAQLAARGYSGSLGRLPHAATEARWVAEIFRRAGQDSIALVDRQATEAQVREQAAGRRIVHLACHGLADQELGNFFGALALAPGENAATDAADDGLLTLAEIYQLDLHRCQLAILSACETNYGPQQQGEGVWALSRGFLVAGSRRVVASNWLVDDEASAHLMSYFCGHVAKLDAAEQKAETPTDYASALHAAKRAIRAQAKWRSPYYWAPMVLIGPR